MWWHDRGLDKDRMELSLPARGCFNVWRHEHVFLDGAASDFHTLAETKEPNLRVTVTFIARAALSRIPLNFGAFVAVFRPVLDLLH